MADLVYGVSQLESEDTTVTSSSGASLLCGQRLMLGLLYLSRVEFLPAHTSWTRVPPRWTGD